MSAKDQWLLSSFIFDEGREAAVLENNCLPETPSSLSGFRSDLKVERLLEAAQLSTRSRMGLIFTLQHKG